MSCQLTAGYLPACKDESGGIKSVYLTAFSNVTYTLLDGEITVIAVATGERFWKWSLEHEVSSAQSVMTMTRANGSIMTDETVNIVLNDNLKATRNQIMLLAPNDLFCIVEQQNGDFEANGLDAGVTLATDTRMTGVALGDRNGNEIVLAGREKQLPPKVASGIIAALLIPTS